MRSRRWRTTKISGLDPSLLPVRTAYTTEPLLTFFDPPVESARSLRYGTHWNAVDTQWLVSKRWGWCLPAMT
jgi:hypothetical protein